MDKINLNKICNRTKEENDIINFLNNFDSSNNSNNSNISNNSNQLNKINDKNKKGIYIYGETGTGKTTFILNILKNNNYDPIYYNSCDIKNKNIIETITKCNMSDKSILTLLNKKIIRPVVVIDEIDGLLLSDKGIISSLVKLIRPKKTKKQQKEDKSLNPIICIGNYSNDKKIKEIMKVCFCVELKKITNEQINIIIDVVIPNLNSKLKMNILNYTDSNLRKFVNIYEIYKHDKTILNDNKLFDTILNYKSYNYNINNTIIKLLNNKYSFSEHLNLMNETDRTIIGLNFHENIIDYLDNKENKITIPFYIEFLENICFADYIDRITFQKQIWEFNEMSSLIKTLKNNKLFHEKIKNNYIYNSSSYVNEELLNNNDVRFTKVLTKYSSEYNNSIFIQNLCRQFMIDKKDLFSFFSFLKLKYNSDINEIFKLFENYEITKLEVNRMFKYIDISIKDEILNDENTFFFDNIIYN
jgi:hypothetical protein